MLYLWLFVINSLVNSSAVITSSLSQSVGDSCLSSPVYVISSFDVSPFPPGRGVTFSIVMQGSFSASSTVSQVQIGLKNNNRWYYNYASINKSFNAGDLAVLRADSTVPPAQGDWIGQVTVIQSGTQAILACWQFSFNN